MRVRGRLDAVDLLRVLLVASVLGPILLLTLIGWFTYRAAFDDARSELLWTSEVAREHASKVFDSFRLAADRTEDLVGPGSEEMARAADPSVRGRLDRMIAGLPQIESLIVLDIQARLILATGSPSVDRSIDFSDRDYVRALQGGTVDTFISQVQTSRITGKRFFGWGRSRRDASDHYAGVVDIAASPTFFSSFYETLVSEVGDSAEGRVVAVVRGDGQIIVRYPELPTAPPRVAPSNPFFQAVRDNPEGGVYTNQSMTERTGPERLFAFRKVPGEPIYIVAGRSTAAIVDEWRGGMIRTTAGAFPAVAALFFVTLATLRGLWRERAALALAKAEMNRREALEDQLRQSQKMEAIGQLTGGIAHDFNNLLTVIRSSTDLLRRPNLSPERRHRYVEAISDTADRAGKLTAQLLAFARRQALNPEPFDVVENVTAIVSMMRALVETRVRIETRLPPASLSVLADPNQFDAALVNLCVNARDATVGEGLISIGVGAESAIPALRGQPPVAGDYVAIEVCDTGSGIAPDQVDRIFEPFFTTKQKGQGTGLGLSQVFGFAKQSKGDIAVVSEVTRGTTFTLYLPRVPNVPKATMAPAHDERIMSRQGLRVLVVEDDPAVAAAVGATLAELDFDTTFANSGEAALVILAAGDRGFDIVFSDVMMPGMTGIELAERIRQRDPAIAILLTSGYSDALVDGSLAVRCELLRKPYSIEALQRALHDAVASVTSRGLPLSA